MNKKLASKIIGVVAFGSFVLMNGTVFAHGDSNSEQKNLDFTEEARSEFQGLMPFNYGNMFSFMESANMDYPSMFGFHMGGFDGMYNNNHQRFMMNINDVPDPMITEGNYQEIMRNHFNGEFSEEQLSIIENRMEDNEQFREEMFNQMNGFIGDNGQMSEEGINQMREFMSDRWGTVQEFHGQSGSPERRNMQGQRGNMSNGMMGQ